MLRKENGSIPEDSPGTIQIKKEKSPLPTDYYNSVSKGGGHDNPKSYERSKSGLTKIPVLVN